ncbi:hypothetical protein L7F22_055770 [Adiantum nelumboides]|nr:hypothetical protein [Adiantum nelumboides]
MQAWKQATNASTEIAPWGFRARHSRREQRPCCRAATQLTRVRKPPLSCHSLPALSKSSSLSSLQPQRQFPLRSEVSNYRAFSVVRLLRIEQGGAYADILSGDGDHAWDKEMDYVARTLGFRTSVLDPRGQRQVTEIVAGITRWKRYLDFLIKAYYDADGYDRMEPLLCQACIHYVGTSLCLGYDAWVMEFIP